MVKYCKVTFNTTKVKKSQRRMVIEDMEFILVLRGEVAAHIVGKFFLVVTKTRF